MEYQIEEPFLCSEQCYEDYAINNLVDDTQSDDGEHDETQEFDGNRINPQLAYYEHTNKKLIQ